MKKRVFEGKFVFLFFMLMLLGIFAGCQQKTPSAETATPSPTAQELILATTTSTQDTGLLDVLIPLFQEKTGYIVKPIAVGTGQALALGERGEADVLLVHAPADEQKLVASGAAVNRQLVMHNDFVLVGPPGDPAGIKNAPSAADALAKIAASKAIFISRGDDSGTHKRELSLWKEKGIAPQGSWYQETGSGMGQTLRVASEKGGYTLTDRGTYLALKKDLQLAILFEGDPLLLNIYHVMQINPEKFPAVNGEGAKAFVVFLTSPEAQAVIEKFGVDKFGEPLFFPDAGKKEEELTR